MFSQYAKKLLNKTVPNQSRIRIARPRGGRRPGAQARPLTAQASPLSQSFPAPSWGNNTNSTNATNMQQPSGSFTFGQQAGSFSSSNPFGSNAAFPTFGGQNTSSGQESNGATSTGFNFAAPQVNNPFASLNQGSSSQPTSGGFTGSIFNIPPSTPAAPTEWGQSKPSPQTSTDSTTSAASPQTSQPPTNIFGQHTQEKPATSNIFAHLQQPTSSSSNIFNQTPAQPQTSNIFGQKAASPFQSQSSQPLSNIFGQSGVSQSQPSNNLFGKPATSPTDEGDTMSTTPDTSPQANNVRARYGPFGSASASPKEALSNGTTPAGSGSSIFSASFQPSSGQGANLTNGEAIGQSIANGESGHDADKPSDISLGSPTKKQGPSSIKKSDIAQPQNEQPHVEEKAPVKNPFAALNFPPPNSSACTSPSFFPLSTPSQKQPSASLQPNGVKSSLLANPGNQTTPATASGSTRQPGTPPEPPAHWSEEQKRQLVTGWRLKSLDVGLQSYLQHGTYSKEEMETVTSYYELRKQAILDAQGGPLLEVSNKRTAEGEQLQSGHPNKKARQQPSSQPSNVFSAGPSSPSKRKANGIIHDDDGNTGFSGAKRSKQDDQIAYPSLPSASSSSQTARIFGDLVGKKISENSSDSGNAVVNGHSFRGMASANQEHSSNPTSSHSDIFKTPAPTGGTLFLSNNNQRPSFSFGQAPTSTTSNDHPENTNTSSQSLSTQTSTPSRELFPPRGNANNNAIPISSSTTTFAQGLATAQPQTSSSIFSSFNSKNSEKRSPKRKAEDYVGEEEGHDEVPTQQGSEQQRHKKQKAAEDGIDTTSGEKATTTERTGFGESVFTRPSTQPTKTSNMFGHLTNSASKPDDHEEEDNDDDDEEAAASEKETARPNALGTANLGTNVSSSNSSRPSVFNPFASSSFNNQPKQSAESGNPAAGRSLFDRIEKNEQGKPVRSSNPVNFGESILKSPAAQNTGSIFGQRAQIAGINPSGTTDSTPGSSIFGNKSTNAAKDTSSAPPAFGMFGKPSSSISTPVANMSGTQAPSDSPSGDNTWKPGTPVKFGDSANAPHINFTSPSPSKPPLTGLFGATKTNTTFETSGSSFFKPADSAAAKPAQLTFGISAPAKSLTPSNDSLAPPSETQSESTSRATSPGATEGESGAESSDAVHDQESHPDLDVTEANKAEADEDVIFAEQGKVYKYAATGAGTHRWELQGNEQLRVLKHRETNKTRMVMKLKVNGRVVLNAGLQKSLSYVLAAPKKVRMPVAANGKVETWMVTFGKEDDAKSLVSALEENKAY